MMGEVPARPLRIYIVDDKRAVVLRNFYIEIWRPEDAPRDTTQASASRWDQHCADIYRRKQVSFDCLSIDVNFGQDNTDPAYTLPRGENDPEGVGYLCSGLYHGIAALARRRTQEEHGNVMPLAWEVRTIAPEIKHLSRQEKIEIVRIYGLLLALSKPFVPDGGFLGLGQPGSEAMAVFEAFRNQDPRVGSALDIGGLIEEWRRLFVASVRSGDIHVDTPSLKAFRLDADRAILREPFDARALFARDSAAIALLDRTGQIAERISLRSIFSDCEIDTPAEFEFHAGKWLVDLMDAVADFSGYIDDTSKWVRHIAAPKKTLDRTDGWDWEAMQNWDGLSGAHQSLIFICYHLASRLDRERFRKLTQDGFFAAVQSNGGEHKVERMFGYAKEDVWIQNLSGLRNRVLKKLADRNLELPFSPSFIAAAAAVLVGLGLERQIEEEFPALHPFLAT
ncbi:MAG TPA: hypothetical protein VIT45_00725 [Allosphingosinicella sp.]